MGALEQVQACVEKNLHVYPALEATAQEDLLLSVAAQNGDVIRDCYQQQDAAGVENALASEVDHAKVWVRSSRLFSTLPETDQENIFSKIQDKIEDKGLPWGSIELVIAVGLIIAGGAAFLNAFEQISRGLPNMNSFPIIGAPVPTA